MNKEKITLKTYNDLLPVQAPLIVGFVPTRKNVDLVAEGKTPMEDEKRIIRLLCISISLLIASIVMSIISYLVKLW